MLLAICYNVFIQSCLMIITDRISNYLIGEKQRDLVTYSRLIQDL